MLKRFDRETAETEGCSLCRYWKSTAHFWGECRRYPPKARDASIYELAQILKAGLPIEADDKLWLSDFDELPKFPEMDADNWCGEFQKR